VVADDEDIEGPPGEFPPGLEELNAEIERLTSSQADRAVTKEQIEHIIRRAAPFVDEARRALAQAHGAIDALPGRIREALVEVNSQAEALLSGAGSLTASGNVDPAVAGGGGLALRGLSFSGVGFVEAAGIVASFQVQKSGSALEGLSPARVFYITLIWLSIVDVAVVIARFKLPSDVLLELQTVPGLVGLALELTKRLAASSKRK
jgi:hypothetical protein